MPMGLPGRGCRPGEGRTREEKEGTCEGGGGTNKANAKKVFVHISRQFLTRVYLINITHSRSARLPCTLTTGAQSSSRPCSLLIKKKRQSTIPLRFAIDNRCLSVSKPGQGLPSSFPSHPIPSHPAESSISSLQVVNFHPFFNSPFFFPVLKISRWISLLVMRSSADACTLLLHSTIRKRPPPLLDKKAFGLTSWKPTWCSRRKRKARSALNLEAVIPDSLFGQDKPPDAEQGVVPHTTYIQQ